ncbi:MAG: tetratricopeptide repeat protein [Gammaproteobacteria bacterium]|nr:tetratricopeptide repeat protein [Gammaproteobacteria bacterium]
MDTLETLLEEIHAAQEAGDRFSEGQSNAKIGKLLLARNIYHDAVNYYQRASNLFEEAEKYNHQARTLNHLGICQVMMAQPQRALESLNKSIELAVQEGDLSLRASAAGNLGLAYSALDDYTKAVEAHKSVLKIAQDLQDQSMELNALINLADASLQNKNFKPAQGFALVAQSLAESLESTPSLVLIYDLLGMISSRGGDLRSAIDYHQQAFETARSLGDLQRQGIALANQGLALEGLTELNKAYQTMQQAQELFSRIKSDYLDKTRIDLERIRKALS